MQCCRQLYYSGQEEAPAAAFGGSDRPVIVDAVGAKTALVSRARDMEHLRDMEHFQSFLFARERLTLTVTIASMTRLTA